MENQTFFGKQDHSDAEECDDPALSVEMSVLNKQLCSFEGTRGRVGRVSARLFLCLTFVHLTMFHLRMTDVTDFTLQMCSYFSG